MNAQPPSHEDRHAVRERPERGRVMHQRWSNLLFLHWQVDPAEIQKRLPEGLWVDTFSGGAWLGLVPFHMERIRPVGLPAVPWLSWFMELNVRTYVYDRHGRPGVWFFSLDCNQPLAVELARRFFHLPYEHARMSAVIDSGEIRYRCARKGAGDAHYRYRQAASGREAEEGTLEWFLVERYLLFSSDGKGRIFSGQVHHRPYLIAPAVDVEWSTWPLVNDGFTVEGAPQSLLVAEPVDVEVYALRGA